MEIAGAEPVTFRNNRIVVGILFVLGLIAFPVSLGMLIGAIAQIFPLHGFTSNRVYSIVILLALAVAFLNRGLWMWRVTRNMAHYQVRLDGQGAHFRLDANKNAPEQSLAWDQIAAVRHKRLGNNQYYAVVGKDARVFEYTALTFMRPKKLARLIAERCGKTIEEM
jgi:hypothetical protein